MGFLSNLLNREAKKVLGDVLDTVADGVSDVIRSAGQTSIAGQTSVAGQTSASGHTTVAQSSGSASRVHREIGKSIAYNEAALRSLLEKNFEELFPEYEVRKNVPASQLNAEAGAENYSYGLFRNGQPKAMIMILMQSNDYRLARIRKAQAACQTQGIPYMNFMYYLPNREDYVANRLRSTILG